MASSIVRLSFTIVVVIAGFILHDINKQGSFKGSQTELFLKDPLKYGKLALTNFRTYSQQAYRWSQKVVPAFIARVRQGFLPFLLKLREVMVNLALNLWNNVKLLYQYIVDKKPTMGQWVNHYAPGLTESVGIWFNETWALTCKYCVKLAALLMKYICAMMLWLRENVFVNDKLTDDLRRAENTINGLEARVNDLQKNYNQAQGDRKKLADENKKLSKENQSMSAQLAESKKMAEEEILKRVEAENLLQTTREELDFKEKLYRQELLETRTKQKVEISEIDGRLNQEYEEKLYAMLQEVRQQFEDELLRTKDETGLMYEEKISNLERQLARNSNAAAGALEEMRKMSTRQEEWQRKLSDIESSNASLSLQVRDLEKQLENERNRHLAEYSRQERELARLHDDMQLRMQEYQDLMDIKVQLDLEIAAYRKLLECEEERLNITPVHGNPGRPANVSGSRLTPARRGTPLMRGGKRKRTLLEDSETSSVQDYTITSSYKTDLEVVDVDPQSKFIKLHNKGKKELAVGKWQVIATADNDQTCTFKFRAASKVKAGEHVTIWSGNSGVDHEPPLNLVMQEQNWVFADQMTIQILNATGDEVGMVERKRTQLSSTLSRSRQTGGELYHQEGDRPGERCSIM